MRVLLLLLLAASPWAAAEPALEPVPLTDVQRARIDAAIAQFPPRAGAAPQAYFLGFAGYGKQRVFAEEIKLAAQSIGTRYGSTPRSVLLINDQRDLETHPLATVAALRHALLGIAKAMNPDEDVLFLALSSHGSRDAMIEVSNTGIPARGLAADTLAELLREAGIRWKVVIVSACFSGTFIEPLADSRTIVLAAASKSRTSFGCSDDRDLTYSGRTATHAHAARRLRSRARGDPTPGARGKGAALAAAVLLRNDGRAQARRPEKRG